KQPVEEVAADWLGLWTDRASGGRAQKWRWQDDHTTLTYQRDSGGSEVIWRDRTTSKNTADDLAPLAWCGRGPGRVALGQTRQSVRTSAGAPYAKSGAADAHALPAGSPYSMVLVWYTNDRVSRILAVHRLAQGNTAKA